MKNATVMNDVRGIQKILEEYLGNHQLGKIAIEISAVMHTEESKYTLKNDSFYVHKDKNNELILSKESFVKKNLNNILQPYIKKEEMSKCIDRLMKLSTMFNFETIDIPGSDSYIYKSLLTYTPQYHSEEIFMCNFKEAISHSVNPFKIFTHDPTIVDGVLQFVPGFHQNLVIGYSYNELNTIAQRNEVRLGSKDEYILFMGTLIHSRIINGISEQDAWYSISSNCHNHADVLNVLAKDENASGFYLGGGGSYPLAQIQLFSDYDFRIPKSIGWFVL